MFCNASFYIWLPHSFQNIFNKRKPISKHKRMDYKTLEYLLNIFYILPLIWLYDMIYMIWLIVRLGRRWLRAQIFKKISNTKNRIYFFLNVHFYLLQQIEFLKSDKFNFVAFWSNVVSRVYLLCFKHLLTISYKIRLILFNLLYNFLFHLMSAYLLKEFC